MATAGSAPAAAAAPPSSGDAVLGDTPLEVAVRQTRACVLRPLSFFVSWQGVLTLAYRGFPAPLVALKAALGAAHGDALPRESPGSKWPKTSLACLREGKRLTPQQLDRLNEICRQQSGILQAPGSVRAQAVLVNSLSAVVYENRCLERVVSRRVMQLAQPADLAGAPPEELQRVQAVMAESDDADYWFHAAKDGNREKHYRSPAPGVTLVHELACFSGAGGGVPPLQQLAAAAAAAGGGTTAAGAAAAAAAGGGTTAAGAAAAAAAAAAAGGKGSGGGDGGGAWSSALPGIVSKFREAVEAELPGMYAWFSEDSLHVTVRAIIV